MAASKPSSQGHFSVTIEIEGPDLKQLTQEAGGLRLQRIPPTERSDRVHTSTVTVAILDPAEQSAISIPESDLKIEWYSGTGSGGQFRNKHQNSCRLTHIPTGIVCTAQTRSRENSYREALSTLVSRVQEQKDSAYYSKRSAEKQQQVGSGQRGDKIRTLRFQDDQATDHRTNKRIKAAAYMRGNMDQLWR